MLLYLQDCIDVGSGGHFIQVDFQKVCQKQKKETFYSLRAMYHLSLVFDHLKCFHISLISHSHALMTQHNRP